MERREKSQWKRPCLARQGGESRAVLPALCSGCGHPPCAARLRAARLVIALFFFFLILIISVP